jgi:Fe-S-cluster-containing dehydrogenase component
MKEPRYAMTMDTRKCVGCSACVLACKNENALKPHAFRDWVRTITSGEFPTLRLENQSLRCNHCSNAPCVWVCPTGASHYDQGGAVLVSPNKCTGCKACIAACPYNARYVNSSGYVDKCTFCLHRVKKGKIPACAEMCPTHSLTFGNLNDPKSEVSKLLQSRKFKVLSPETGTKPNLYLLL